MRSPTGLRRLLLGTGTALAAAGIAFGPAQLAATVPIATAVATLLWATARRPDSLERLARPTAASATLTLTAVFTAPGSWGLVQAVLLLPLLAAVVRWSPVRELRVATPLTALAIALWPVPLMPDAAFLEQSGAAAFWLLPALLAAAVGGQLRRAEVRRRGLVAETRRAQRLQIARDLHDFVAHDVSGIVVQAQAARFVAATDPEQAVLALERIEKAGLSALAAMDRTVEALHGPDAAATGPLPGPDHLPALIDRFTSAASTEARLTLPSEAADALARSREAGATAYRIVVEALTNVRRHAPTATRVDVALTRSRTGVDIRITNDRPQDGSGRTRRSRSTRGGLGLPGLTERVEALGGTLSAGPYDDGGWQLLAALPLSLPLQQETP
ncbi:histidine kinase [Streptomyces sp. E11-3]|uniref:sensor histidine kinase n=1 Tax=Streptomyces sp. E11-3 TaxID=3110112 RepID=UPI00397FEE91